MDKYEFNIKIEQIRKRMDEGDYATAMRIADAIDWSRVRNINLLSLASSVYEKNGEYDEAKDKLLLAFERAPIGKRLLYKLTELSVETGDLDEAKDYYNEFLDVAPEDPSAHVLAYMILEKAGAPYDRLISELSAYAAAEPDERWLYELARIYDEAGYGRECVATCDKVALMFGKGRYSELCLKLKAKYQSLTDSQQELIHEEEGYMEDMDDRSPEEIGNELAAIRYENEDEAFEEYLKAHNLDKPLVDVEESMESAGTERTELREELSREVERIASEPEKAAVSAAATGGSNLEAAGAELEKTLVLDGERLTELRNVIIRAGEAKPLKARPDAATAVRNAAKQASDIAASLEKPAASISVESVKPIPAPGLGKDDIAPVLEAERRADEMNPELRGMDTKQEADQAAKQETEGAPAGSDKAEMPEADAETAAASDKAPETVKAAAEAVASVVAASAGAAAGGVAAQAAEAASKTIDTASAISAAAAVTKGAATAAKAGTEAISEALPKAAERQAAAAAKPLAAKENASETAKTQVKVQAQAKADTAPLTAEGQEPAKAPVKAAQKHHMIIEAEDEQTGFEIAKDELKAIHHDFGIQNAALKTSAKKLNERGLSESVIEKIRGKDFIIEHAGDLSPKLLDSIYRLIRDDDSGMIAVLIDVPEGLDRIEARKPEIFGLCDLVSDFEDEYEDGPEDGDDMDADASYKDDEGYDESEDDEDYDAYDESDEDGYDDEGYDEDDYEDEPDDEDAGYDDTEDEDYEDPRKRGSRKENAELHNNLKVQAPGSDEQMEIDDFAQYCCQYAAEIDCSITGKSMLALYERIELMEEDNIPLTRKNAVRLIEEAADRAEKPPIGKRIKGMFSSKYDKNGLLILKEEDFIY